MAAFPVQLISKRVFSNDPAAFSLYESRNFGERVAGSIVYLLEEAFFLFKEKKIFITDYAGKRLLEAEVLARFKRIKKDFLSSYVVFADLRKKGYVVKTALKFGAEFRVYDKGANPRKAHARWAVFPVLATDTISWQDFCAKNRIAHSSKKHLLIAVIDGQADISYYSVDWTRP